MRFGWPQRGMRLIAVTGTDGKTTTVQMLAAVLRADGRRVGLISTVGASINPDSTGGNGQQMDLAAHVSTPGPWQIYQLVRDMRRAGVKDVVIETTSHGLHQRRMAGLRFAVGIITNISPEHLDYHKTLSAYATAKLRLTTLCRTMIVNGEDKILAHVSGPRINTFGWSNQMDVWADGVKDVKGKTTFRLHIGQRTELVELSLPGRFNVLNALAAAGAADKLGVDLAVVARGLKTVGGVAGRWQVVQKEPYWVVVDFGHTPQAFEQILPLARKYVGSGGRLIHLFGCAGGRDAIKRHPMGELSGRLADVTVLTTEDPRRESVESIQAQVIEGVRAGGNSRVERIDDRAEAISWAIGQAKPGDVVLLTGKGHETSMNIAGQEKPWNEVEVARQAITATD